MPTYTFIVAQDSGQQVELADDDAAWSALITFAGELLRDIDGHLEAGQAFEVAVFDAAGQEVAAAAVDTRRRPRR